MKKNVLVVLLIFAGAYAAMGQEVGIRFGDVNGSNAAVDGIFSTGRFSRIHADVSFSSGIGVDALWDFLYRPIDEEEFFWYVGAGPFIFLGDDFALGAAGEIGIEYHFMQAPVALGLDWRPYFRIMDNTDVFFGGFGFNVRYVF